ncbi:DUF2784 domain-containing protein [Nocardiopsis sp. RSe5-2]|uniref:DUF2784 domain-containing protein n=1 Tax=Nocardiopsis endophytica TaxID=3018445 RepID=A0ABT4UDR8_9ACTN|nr:DUF2784 domain-containing protein [Nocardiopsis endophytica]MDA2815132.1 DUF2784 domain-containing protein [Nocardiopsis endophytica]
MGYRLLGEAAMLLHFAFLAYVTLGGLLAWRWPALLWPHALVAAYALAITLVGWDCPLTHVEDWARVRAGQAGLPPEGFIEHYLTGVIYPAEHLLTAQLAVAAAVAASWAGAAVLAARRRARRRARGGTGPRWPGAVKERRRSR